MEALRQYVLSVICTALICGIVLALVPEGSGKAVVKLLCGACLTVTLTYPLSRIKVEDMLDLSFEMGSAEQICGVGRESAQQAMEVIIKDRCEAYIHDKAAALGTKVEADITLSREEPSVPVAAKLSGRASPNAKGKLETILQQDLGIPKERVTWTG